MDSQFVEGGSDFITVQDLDNQRHFSTITFGPGKRTKGVIGHIRKELVEIENDPSDGTEWIDVLILALDGALRFGYTPEQIAAVYRAKMWINSKRDWPDYRLFTEDEPIEHVRV